MKKNHNTNANTERILADTVKILLSKGQFTKSPSNKWQTWLGESIAKQSVEDKKSGFYRPRIKYNHWSGDVLIEFSIAKLLYGNNLQTVFVADFPAILSKLKLHLMDYGIETNEEMLAESIIIRIDWGINIFLPKDLSADSVLRQLNGCLTSGHKHQFRIQYENGGHALRIGTASSDLLLYSKLDSPEVVGGVDYYEKKPLREILGNFHNDVLRIEKRFTQRRKVRKIFSLYGIANPVFEDICNSKIGHNVIVTEWNLLMNSCLTPPQTNEDILTQITTLLHDKITTPRKVLALVCLQQALRNHPALDVKQLLLQYYTPQTVDVWLKDIKKINPYRESSTQEALQLITRFIKRWPQIEFPLNRIAKDGESATDSHKNPFKGEKLKKKEGAHDGKQH